MQIKQPEIKITQGSCNLQLFTKRNQKNYQKMNQQFKLLTCFPVMLFPMAFEIHIIDPLIVSSQTLCLASEE